MQIYKNRYFTNHGPLTQQFENELEAFLSVSNAVTIMNNTLAILVAISSGPYNGKKVAILSGCEKDILDAANMSNVDFIYATIESLAVEPLPSIGMVVISSYALTKDNFSFFKDLVKKGIKVIVCYPSLSNFNDHKNLEGSISVYSLNSETLVQGGIVTTNNDNLAEVFRNIRSSYGVRKILKVKATCNGRFSELQSGLGLIMLDQIRK